MTASGPNWFIPFLQISLHFSMTEILRGQRKEVENLMCGKEHFFRWLVQKSHSVPNLNEHSGFHLYSGNPMYRSEIQSRVWPLSHCVHLMHLNSFKDIRAKHWANVNGLWHLLASKHINIELPQLHMFYHWKHLSFCLSPTQLKKWH